VSPLLLVDTTTCAAARDWCYALRLPICFQRGFPRCPD
jgi:hypothetical protein